MTQSRSICAVALHLERLKYGIFLSGIYKIAMASNLPHIPFKYVPEECRLKIANTLDCEGPTSYKIFAQKLDKLCNYNLQFDSEYLNALAYRKHYGGPSYEVLRVIAEQGIFLPVVYQVLRDMCLQVAKDLVNYSKEIITRYEKSQPNPQGSSNNKVRMNRCACHQCKYDWSCTETDTQTGNITPIHGEPHLVESRRHDVGSSMFINNRPRTGQNCLQKPQNLRAPQQRHNGNGMNDLSLGPNHRHTFSRQIPSFNISSIGRQASVDENDRGVCVCPSDFHPPSDFEEDDYICESCEDSRRQYSDETQRKTFLQTSLQQNCPNCSTHYASSPTASNEAVNSINSRKVDEFDNRRFSDSDVSSRSGSGQDLRRSRSHEDWRDAALKCTCGQQRIPATVQNQQKQIKIFVSFAQDNNAHLECVFDLMNRLKELGFRIRCDMYHKMLVKINLREYEEKQKNTNDWLQRNFEEADYIIFCISPLYYEYTKPPESSPNITCHKSSVEPAIGSQPDVSPSDDHLHVKYIYNQAHVEYMNALCKNKRFLPVLFTYSHATREHVPAIFNSTNVYSYPDVDELLWFLKQVEVIFRSV